jgi:RNA polymerase primary sigma factor
VAAHLELVRAAASRYRGLGMPFDDLVQEGLLGLLDAVDRYDPSRGVAFETFARFRVRRAIRNALTEQARLVRLPKQIVERQRMLAALESRLAAANGRAPTASELAAGTGLPLAAVCAAQAAPTTSATPGELGWGSSPDDPERELVAAEEASLLREAVARLTPCQREIITRHFGLEGDEAAVAVFAILATRRSGSAEAATGAAFGSL